MISKKQLEGGLLTTEELFKKMHLILAPNKSNWLYFLKHEYSNKTQNFLQRLSSIDLEAASEKHREKKVLTRKRGISIELHEKKYKNTLSGNLSPNLHADKRRGSLDFAMAKRIRSKSVYNTGLKGLRNKLAEKVKAEAETGEPFTLILHKMPLAADKNDAVEKGADNTELHKGDNKKQIMKELSKKLREKLKVKEEPEKANSIKKAEGTIAPTPLGSRKMMQEMIKTVLDKKGATVAVPADKGHAFGSGTRMFEYLRYCAEEKVIPLPIMSNVSNGTLTLENHKLTHGVSKALGKFIPVPAHTHVVPADIEEVGAGEQWADGRRV